MRQRVELARALGGETPLLLMDEPFSSLDYLARLKMRRELARILREQPRTVVLVTHDIEEAAQLADRVLVLSERPARVRDEVLLEMPRPRDPTHPEVVRAVHRILTVLGLGIGDARHRGQAHRTEEEHERDVVAVRTLGRGRPGLRRGPRRAAAAAVAASAGRAGRRSDGSERETLAVGFLPVTCHLTCPVTDFASKTSRSTRFESQRFTDFPTVVETVKSGRLDATFMIAPLAMKLREQGVKVRIAYLGHRDGSTVMVRKDLPAKSLKDLERARVCDPQQVQQPVPGHPQADEG